MCVENHRRSKSIWPSTPSSPNRNEPKHLKTFHPLEDVETKTDNKSKAKPTKSVTFNEVAVVRSPFEFKYLVAFHEFVIIRPSLHLVDYTNQEIIDCWYDLEDKQRIVDDIRSAIKQSKTSSSSECVGSSSSKKLIDCCTRGLEKHLDGGRARERRRVSIREILEEQESQRSLHNEGTKDKPFVCDTTKLRQVYKLHSQPAHHASYVVAKIDELDAFEE